MHTTGAALVCVGAAVRTSMVLPALRWTRSASGERALRLPLAGSCKYNTKSVSAPNACAVRVVFISNDQYDSQLTAIERRPVGAVYCLYRLYLGRMGQQLLTERRLGTGLQTPLRIFRKQ